MNILENNTVNNFLMGVFVRFYNFSYAVISSLAVRKEKGIHPKHQILKYHDFFLDNVSSHDKIIDIGCGSGLVSFILSKKVKKITGMDINNHKIKKAKQIYKKRNLNYIYGDATVYKFKEKFDKIVLSNVLEHIEKRIFFLRKLHRLSSVILLRVPMIDRDWLPIYLKKRGYDYRLDKTHFTEFTVNKLKKELNSAGWGFKNFNIKFGEIWGVAYDLPESTK